MKILKVVLSFVLVVALVCPCSVFAQAVTSEKIGDFSQVTGEVNILRAGKPLKAAVKTPVLIGDVITTGKGAKAQITLNDESVVTIDQNTKFDVRQFAIQGGKRQARFGLAVGSVVSNVKKYIGSGNTFEIQGPQAVAGVRGTVFVVTVVIAANGVPTMTVSVLSGTVILSSAAGTLTLVAGQAATVVGAGMPTITGAAVTGATTTATGTTTTAAGTTTTAAAGTTTTAAAGAGAAAGTTTVAGVGVGTVAGVTVVTAAVAAVVVQTTKKSDTPAHH